MSNAGSGLRLRLRARPARKPGRRRWRWIGRLALLVPVLGMGGVIAANLLLLLSPVRSRLERGLSAALGAPARVERVTWTPWGGIRLRGLVVAAPREAATLTKAPFFESDAARLRFHWLPLFSGIVDISEIAMDAPRIACVRGEDGRLLHPFGGGPPVVVEAIGNPFVSGGAGIAGAPSPGDGETAPVDGGKGPAADGQEVTAAPPAPPTAGDQATGRRASRKSRSLEVRLREVVIRKGSVTLLGNDGSDGIARLRNVEMRVDLSGEQPGTFHALRADVLGRLRISDIRAAVAVDGGAIRLQEIRANWGGGGLGGAVQVGLTQPGVPFSADLNSVGLTPGAFIKPAGEVDAATRSALESAITVRLRLAGFARSLDTVRGALLCEGLQLPVAALVPGDSADGIGGQAGILDFEIARILFRLSRGAIVFDDVHFNADTVVIRAAGSIAPSGELNVAVRTYVPAAAVTALGAFMSGWPEERLLHFTGLEHTDYIYRDALLSGTVGAPAVDLWQEGRFLPLKALLGEIRSLREAGTRSAGGRSAAVETSGDGSSAWTPLPRSFATPAPTPPEDDRAP